MMNWAIDLFHTYIPTWLLITLVVHGAVLGSVAYLILLERKIASWVQDRIGPNRVGLGGLLPLILLPITMFVDLDKFIDKIRGYKMLGLGQPLADGLKFIVKEDYRPKNVDRILFSMAPMIMIVTIIISIAVIPWGGTHRRTITVDVTGAADPVAAAIAKPGLIGSEVVTTKTIVGTGATDNYGNVAPKDTKVEVTYQYPFQIASVNVGILFILGTLSLAVYGVVIGGWASNNKYSFLGGLRATANMVSYEIPLSLCVLSVVLVFGTLDLGVIVEKQTHTIFGFLPAWGVFTQPLAFIIFLVCIHAEANRAPFDTAEAEQELVGGYHTEYSAMRFALFFLAEYAGMITTSAVCVALFFGGWHLPGLNGGLDATNHALTDSILLCIVRGLVFFGKTIAIIAIFMWVRWSLPRFRFDQIMQLAWRALIPISLAMVMVTAVVVYLTGGSTFVNVDNKSALMLLGSQIVLTGITMFVSTILPKAPPTNRRIAIPGSRFGNQNATAETVVATAQ